jgi:hypothetical protein
VEVPWEYPELMAIGELAIKAIKRIVEQDVQLLFLREIIIY